MKRILVVEDEPLLLAAMKHALSALPDVRVSASSEVAEAKGLIACDHPDLVIADLKLPDGAGIELLGALDALGLRSPIVFLSAYLDQYGSTIPDGRSIEVRAKPISMDALQKLARRRLSEPLRPPFSVTDYIQIASMAGESLRLRLKRGREEVGRVVIVEGKVWSAKTADGESGPRALTALVETSDYRTLLDPLDKQPLDVAQFSGDTDAVLLAASGQAPTRVPTPDNEPVQALAPTAPPPVADPFSSMTSVPSLMPVLGEPAPGTDAPVGVAPPVGALPPRPASSGLPAKIGSTPPAPLPPIVASHAVPTPKANRPMVSGPVIVAAIIGLAAVAVALILKPGEYASASIERGSQPGPAKGVSAADVQALLDRAETLMSSGRFDDAVSLLEGIGTRHEGSAQQRIQIIELLSNAGTGQGLALAQQALEQGQDARAMEALRSVLLHRPSQPRALELLKSMRERAAQLAVGSTPDSDAKGAPTTPTRIMITLVSKPHGLFLIDGTPIGYSPLKQQRLGLGPHRIEVRREGYHPLVRSLKVNQTSPASVIYELKPSL